MCIVETDHFGFFTVNPLISLVSRISNQSASIGSEIGDRNERIESGLASLKLRFKSRSTM